MFGYGYGGARFRKGSPEAKAFMARLRAMRRGRRKGGMFKGVTHSQLERLLVDAEQAEEILLLLEMQME